MADVAFEVLCLLMLDQDLVIVELSIAVPRLEIMGGGGSRKIFCCKIKSERDNTMACFSYEENGKMRFSRWILIEMRKFQHVGVWKGPGYDSNTFSKGYQHQLFCFEAFFFLRPIFDTESERDGRFVLNYRAAEFQTERPLLTIL